MRVRKLRAGPGRLYIVGALVAVLTLIAGGLATASASSARPANKVAASVAASYSATGPKPTVVLVHGAFADASGWSAVARRLTADGYPVYAPANPLRGLQGDTDYLKSFLATIKGPIVLVGHSYGGAVISNAATGNPQVKGLVYVAAYALDQGETVDAANKLGGHPEESLLLANVEPRPYPGAPKGDADIYIKVSSFPKVFAADLPLRKARFMAIAQRPAAYFSLGTPSGVPAWKTIPSWYVVASQDKAIPPTAESYMAKRAKARTITVKSSHVAMMSHPGAVTKVIKAAAHVH